MVRSRMATIPLARPLKRRRCDHPAFENNPVLLAPESRRDAREVLRQTVSARFRRDVSVVDVTVPIRRLTRQSGDLQLISQISLGIRATAAVHAVRVSVVRPQDPSGPRAAVGPDLELAGAFDAAALR